MQFFAFSALSEKVEAESGGMRAGTAIARCMAHARTRVNLKNPLHRSLPHSTPQPPTHPKETMSLFAPAPEPATPLGRHRPLAPLAGVHLSPICLGAMSIGDKWAPFNFGAMVR